MITNSHHTRVVTKKVAKQEWSLTRQPAGTRAPSPEVRHRQTVKLASMLQGLQRHLARHEVPLGWDSAKDGVELGVATIILLGHPKGVDTSQSTC